MTLEWKARWTPWLKCLAVVAACFFLWQLRYLAPHVVPAAQESDFEMLETLLADGTREREGVDVGLPDRFLALTVHSMFGPPAQSAASGPGIAVGPTLHGIGVDYAFIKTKSGAQMIRVGEQRDGVRVIRIGMNRVLIEHAGEISELTIYSGLGSDPLLEPDQGEEQ